MHQHSSKPARQQQISRRKFLKLAVVGAIAASAPANALIIEPRRIEVTRHDVLMPRLPKALDGFTIAQVSDLHRSKIVPDSLLEAAVGIVNRLSPDIAVATGDFVNTDASNAEPCARILSHLSSRLGAFAVLGNHDHWTDGKAVAQALENHGIRVLDNTSASLAPGLELLGLDDYWSGHPDFAKTWRKADPEAAHVFLCHNPLAVRKMSSRECLMITGHTHGGQVQIPFIPRNRLPGLKGWHFIEGWYQVGNTRMYVNRGIGMINPPIRFLCRPEVTLYTLKSA